MGILEILKDIKGNKFKEYKGIPFWSWNNTLEKEELVSQIEQMKNAGMGGFIIHARTGLKDEYLGEKWYSCIQACLQKANELEMEAWLYDENGWPSGFAGGALLKKEYCAQFLEIEEHDYFDENAYCCYIINENNEYLFTPKNVGNRRYFCIYIKFSTAFTDILNPDVVQAFIDSTHEEYYKRFKNYFGNTLVGIFTDEPQYFRYKTPFTKMLRTVFSEEELKQNLIYLFKSDEKGYPFKFKYYKALGNFYEKNYYKKVYEWCVEHNCKLTGHTVEESSLSGQMWCCAGAMPTYEFEHIPAIDWLSRSCKTELSPKQVGSVASQLDKKIVLTETFACCGYNATPKELRSVAEVQYFNGVNKMCHHLFPYSIAGQGKFDHPPVFSSHSNWFDEFREFNDYFTRLGYIIGNTEEIYDVGVIHPIRSAYLDYLREQDYASIRELEGDFNSLISDLRASGVTFQLIDESMLSGHGSIENGRLKVGKNIYSTLIVPKMKNISSSTIKLLKKYTGKLCSLGNITYVDGERKPAEIVSNITLQLIKENALFKFDAADKECQLTARSGEIGEFVFVKNLSQNSDCKIKIEGLSKKYSRLNLANLSLEKVEDTFTVGANDSVIFVKEKGGQEYNINKKEDITNRFSAVEISENYLVLDKVCFSKDGVNFSEEKYIQDVFDNLLYENYKGKIYIRQKFCAQGKIEDLKICVEKAKYLYYKLNGIDVQFYQSDFDVNFLNGDISGYIVEGANTIEYSIDFYQHDGVWKSFFDKSQISMETLRTSVYFDTSIENAYLKGSFIVGDDLQIIGEKKLPKLGDIVSQGYKFFKGEVTYSGCVNYNGKDRITLEIGGIYMVANVYINGARVDYVFENAKEITKHLKLGENSVYITIKSSLRNLLGPHHHAGDADLTKVSPYHFIRRGEWVDGIPKGWSDEYKCVQFGLEKVEIIIHK